MSSVVGGLFLDLWERILDIEDTLRTDPAAARAAWTNSWRAVSHTCWELRALVKVAVIREWNRDTEHLGHLLAGLDEDEVAPPARPWPTTLVSFYALTCYEPLAKPSDRRVPWEKDLPALCIGVRIKERPWV